MSLSSPPMRKLTLEKSTSPSLTVMPPFSVRTIIEPPLFVINSDIGVASIVSSPPSTVTRLIELVTESMMMSSDSIRLIPVPLVTLRVSTVISSALTPRPNSPAVPAMFKIKPEAMRSRAVSPPSSKSPAAEIIRILPAAAFSAEIEISPTASTLTSPPVVVSPLPSAS